MKKVIVIVCIIILCVCLCFFYIHDERGQTEKEEYCYKINALIKDADFNIAKIEGSKIMLYDIERNLTDEIAFEDYSSKFEIEYIRKEDEIIYFVFDVAVDDEWGIIFVNDDSDKMLNGIKSIKRIGGNSYSYSTIE